MISEVGTEQDNKNQWVSAGGAVKYFALPGIIPRTKEFFSSGFGFIAHLMALIYGGIRLLPANHPYTKPENIGRFGIRHVIAEAANNLVISKKNIDQIIVFVALLAGIVILFGQFVLLIASLVINPALAGPLGGLPGFTGFFTTPGCPGAACEDIAFRIMDEVFAVPNLFSPNIDPDNSTVAIPVLNGALHELFEFYNIAILLVGVLIFVYYLFLIVGETATSGTPFGRRFNHVWAPLRLVLAVGLLIPLNFGYNSAQYITLFAAKFGSSFATNVWQQYNRSIVNSPGGANAGVIGAPDGGVGGQPGQNSLVSMVKAPDVAPIVEFMSTVLVCKAAYEQAHRGDAEWTNNGIEPFWVFSGTSTDTGLPESISDPMQANFADAKDWFVDQGRGNDIRIAFGREDVDKFARFPGAVNPYCGEMKVEIQDTENAGAEVMQGTYYNLIWQLWNLPRLQTLADRVVAKTFVDDGQDVCAAQVDGYAGDNCGGDLNAEALLPDPGWKRDVIEAMNVIVQDQLNPARQALINQIATPGNEGFNATTDLLNKGWAGAGIWYNRIAEWNGSIVAASIGVPTPIAMPVIMKKVEDELKKDAETLSSCNRYSPSKADGDDIDELDSQEKKIAVALNEIYQYWSCPEFEGDPAFDPGGNFVFDVMRVALGLDSLLDIRSAENQNIHPMAQLSAIGKGIIEASVRNLMGALGASFLGGVSEIIDSQNPTAGFFKQAASTITAFTTLGLTIGFVLYYVLPFLPFIYFFFGLGKWVKSVFEAMVGVPLWALAHLRIDGNGLPGETASNGYFLIFEIFLRPVLVVFGLLASIAIFTALARTLNGIWDLVVVNTAGFECHSDGGAKANCAGTSSPFDPANYRYIADQFFFTIIYTIMIYLLGTGSFKLIDQIPSSILRWIGSGAQSFADTQKDDPVGGLTRYAAIGGNVVGGQVVGAANQGATALGQVVGLPFGIAIGRGGGRGGRAGGDTSNTPSTSDTSGS